MENKTQLKYKVGNVLYHEYKDSWRIIKIIDIGDHHPYYIRFEYKVLYSNNANDLMVFTVGEIYSFLSKPKFNGFNTYNTAIKVDIDNLPKEILAKIL